MSRPAGLPPEPTGPREPLAALAAIVARTPVATIDEVQARMQEIDGALERADGVACFNKLYLAVTVNVIAAEAERRFVRSAFIRALDVAFGNLYFAALASLVEGRTPPRAWAPLFDARRRTDIAPLQFALAGMNAHINRDLPLGIVEACQTLGLELRRPSDEARDYDAINDVLAETEAQVAESYFTPLLRELDRAFDGVDDLAANWSVRMARAAAWSNAAALWHLRAHPTLSAEYLAALDGTVGFAGRGLLVPTAI